MIRVLGHLIAIVTLFAIPVSVVGFSYEFSIDGHAVIVTGLSNGKSFVKLDGKLQTPENGIFRIQTGKIDIVVMKSGQITYIGDDDLSITLASPVGKIDRQNPVKIGKKVAYRSAGGDEEPLWNFHYYLKCGKTVLDILIITNQNEGKEPPKIFSEIVRTLKSREVK